MINRTKTASNAIKSRLPVVVFRKLLAWIRNPEFYNLDITDHECPVCGYKGRFLPLGTNPRRHGRCPGCGSRERHRLMHLCLQAKKIDLTSNRQILHFSAEKYFIKMMQNTENYHTADIVPGKARHTMDMMAISFPDTSLDLIISNHVLEHIDDDLMALNECYRVLKPRGIAFITVPIDWSRQVTYESHEVKTAEQRIAHYGDGDHLRLYGRDFADRLVNSGFEVECWRMADGNSERYGLFRDDVIWIATKP